MTLEMKIAEEKAIAKFELKVSVLKSLIGKISNFDLATALHISDDQFSELTELIESHPEMEDWEIAQEYVFNGKTYNS